MLRYAKGKLFSVHPNPEVEMMYKVVLLVFTLLAAYALPANGQRAYEQHATSEAVQPTSEFNESNSAAQGTLDGEIAAADKGSASWALGGFAGGVGLGLIGTGVAYGLAANSSATLPADKVVFIQGRSADYRLAYQRAYKDGVQRKRKRSALVGGFVGTAAIVTVLVASGAN
ncbi:MAG: hypothetical protein ACR2GR_02335 [Rhodothermales bacterium]